MLYEGTLEIPQWEYKFVRFDGITLDDLHDAERLNEMGKDGWEVVGLESSRALMKRLKIETCLIGYPVVPKDHRT